MSTWVSAVPMGETCYSTDFRPPNLVGGWSKNFDGPEDWNLTTVPQSGADNREVRHLKLDRHTT